MRTSESIKTAPLISLCRKFPAGYIGNYKINIDNDYVTVWNIYVNELNFQDELESTLSELPIIYSKKSAVNLLLPLIGSVEKIISPDIKLDARRFYQVLAGSYARALLEGDFHSKLGKNTTFIADAQSIEIGEHILFSDKINLLTALKLFAQDTRGYLSHLGQAQNGTTKFFRSPRWPIKESPFIIEFIGKCLPALIDLYNAYNLVNQPVTTTITEVPSPPPALTGCSFD